MANKEDGCTGHFWEGRFQTQTLLDDAAVLSSMVYVDLNPIRAGIAKTPEDSPHTSIRKRIEQAHNEHHHDLLHPIASSINSQLMSESHTNYLTLVDWSGRILHPKKTGAIAAEFPEILKRLNLRRNQWLIQVPATESHFWRVIGNVESILAHAKDSGCRWVRGIGMARVVRQRSETF